MASHATAIRCRGVLGTSACAQPVINSARCQQMLVHAMAVSVAVSAQPPHHCAATHLPVEDDLALLLVPLLSLGRGLARLSRKLGAELGAQRPAVGGGGAAQLPDERDAAPPRQRCRHGSRV